MFPLSFIRSLFPGSALALAGVMSSFAAVMPDAAPFSDHLNQHPPRILRHIGPEADSSAKPLPAGVVLERFVFESRINGTITNEVFSVVARPETKGANPLPALLLLHGGGGNATQETAPAAAWAARGYVVLTLDLPGIANPKGTPHSAGEWTRLPYGEGRWTVTPDLTASTICQGVSAALDAFALLRARPDVDPARIGVTGTSWGGYTTTMVCGLLGDQVRAGFSNYGCGFYEDTTFRGSIFKLPAPQRERWLAQLDAGRRAPGIKTPFFIAGATNDTFFYPPAVERTLAAITAPGLNRVHAPNAHHKLPLPGGVTGTGGAAAMAADWFAFHLQGKGEPFPVITVDPFSAADANPVSGDMLRFRVQGPAPVTAAAVWYSLPPDEGGWPKREWKEIRAVAKGDGRYEAVLPSGIAEHAGAAWFALVSDDRPVSVSSRMIMPSG
ncbi:dipeptidyl aminopeptidase [Opitutaceae bacterium TAV5]|nr:dipeptidyl aminopeptidase [Opitutaceae bacterium TAV5]